MTKITLKVEQNGGEYHGYVGVSVESATDINVVGYKTLKVDGMTIEFDECIQIVNIKQD